MMKFFSKNWLLLLLVAIAVALVSTNWFERQKRIKAELTNIELKARLAQSEAIAARNREKFDLLSKVATVKIDEWRGKALAAQDANNAIKVKSAVEIKAIRTLVLDWQAKYNVLEPECLRLTDKVSMQAELISAQQGQIDELNARDEVRLGNIAALQGQLADCQKLLGVSIKNTDSLLKQSWMLKLFSKLTVVAGMGIGIDGVMRPCVAVGVKIL